MKLLATLLFFSLLARAGANDPGSAAMAFLEKVRKGNLNLEPGGDTALSAQTVEDKRREIAARLEKIGDELGNGSLEVLAIREDREFAGVLVSKSSGFDPAGTRVFPVALVKKGAEWLAAPLPASFENAGAGYALEVRKRLQSIENWMLKEQVVNLQTLREQSASVMRRKIEAGFPLATLKAMGPEEAGKAFLSACTRRDLPAVLALLGGLSSEPPADWGTRLKAAGAAFERPSEATGPWKLLSSPETIKVIHHHDTRTMVVACLSRGRRSGNEPRPQVTMIHLDLAKDDQGLWRVDPPVSFFHPEDEDAVEDDGTSATESFEKFATAFSSSHPAVTQPDAAAAWEAFIKTMQGSDMERALALTDFNGPQGAPVRNCLAAATLWYAIHDPSQVCHPVPLSFKAEENIAAGLLQIARSRNPDRMDTRIVYFGKTPAGWLWMPDPPADTKQEFATWADAETQRGKDKWMEQVFQGIPVITNEDLKEVPTPEEARECIAGWMAAVESGDVGAALGKIALLSDPKSSATAFRNIGYEIIAARNRSGPAEVTGIYQREQWTAVGMKVPVGEKTDHPLFTLVTTASGTRILIEIDLFASPTRGFLNKTSFELLERSTNKEATGALKEIYAQHLEDSQKRG